MIEFANALDRLLQLLIIGEQAANLGDPLALSATPNGPGLYDVILMAVVSRWRSLDLNSRLGSASAILHSS
jgi:hypothetical protein